MRCQIQASIFQGISQLAAQYKEIFKLERKYPTSMVLVLHVADTHLSPTPPYVPLTLTGVTCAEPGVSPQYHLNTRCNPKNKHTMR